jgi:hypothetical protein
MMIARIANVKQWKSKENGFLNAEHARGQLLIQCFYILEY